MDENLAQTHAYLIDQKQKLDGCSIMFPTKTNYKFKLIKHSNLKIFLFFFYRNLMISLLKNPLSITLQFFDLCNYTAFSYKRNELNLQSTRVAAHLSIVIKIGKITLTYPLIKSLRKSSLLKLPHADTCSHPKSPFLSTYNHINKILTPIKITTDSKNTTTN